ncbi:hypothetical protein V8E53_013329 [Lactarius tabidus]
MSAPLHTCWASADDWQPGFVILGANIKAIPTPPPQSPVIVGADGSWGAHEWTVYLQPHHREFPYLAWIPLCQSNTFIPSSIHTPIDKSMWQAHPDQPNIHAISPPLLDMLKKEWEFAKVELQDPYKTFSSDPSFSSVWYLKETYLRALAALIWLEKDFEAWQDFVKLLAFSDWWRDIHADNKFQSLICAPTQGAIFEDTQLYENYVQWSVGALLLVHKSNFVLDPSKEVALSSHTLCKLFKSGCRAKKAKANLASLATSPNNQELRHLTDARAVPDWFPEIQGVWKHAISHITHLNLAAQESHCFGLPPIHLFWGESARA